MRPADRAEFVRVMNGMASIRRTELTAEALDLWWAALSDWDLSSFKSAATHLVRSCKFMPTPFDFEQLRRAALPTGGEAWEKAIAACFGWRYGTATVDDFTDRVVRMVGGYERLAMEPLDTQHFTRNKFVELYEELAETEAIRESVPQIAGPPTTPRIAAGVFKTLGWQPPALEKRDPEKAE